MASMMIAKFAQLPIYSKDVAHHIEPHRIIVAAYCKKAKAKALLGLGLLNVQCNRPAANMQFAC